MRISDWSSDVCSSDLAVAHRGDARRIAEEVGAPGGQDHTEPAERHGDPEQHQGHHGEDGDEFPALAVDRHQNGTDGVHEVVGPRSEEHTSELQSLMRISYAVFCLKKKTYTLTTTHFDR